ncbi:MAG: hypothetical protein M1594_02755 [Candidatus Marsarchaeota archaeon]|nr:hypothetical protein [Candidatus Marsarchaeota archaeon]
MVGVKLFRFVLFLLDNIFTFSALIFLISLGISVYLYLTHYFPSVRPVWFEWASVALLAILPLLLFFGIIIFFLLIVDVAVSLFPEQSMSVPFSTEVVKARITRVFAEKEIGWFLFSASFGFENIIMNFFKKVFKLSPPLSYFSRNPFVLVRLYSKGNSTNVSIISDSNIRARTLAKYVETSIKYL